MQICHSERIEDIPLTYVGQLFNVTGRLAKIHIFVGIMSSIATIIGRVYVIS